APLPRAPRASGRLPKVGRTGRLVPQGALVVGVLDLLGDVRHHAEHAQHDQQILPHDEAHSRRALSSGRPRRTGTEWGWLELDLRTHTCQVILYTKLVYDEL